MTRREFLRLLSTGALSTAFLSTNLGRLLAQEEGGQAESLVWLLGHQSQTHSVGLLGLPEYPSLLGRYFQRLETEGEEPKEGQNPPILILEGSFPDDALERGHQILQAWVSRAKVVVLLGNEASYANENPGGYLDLLGQTLSDYPVPVIRLPELDEYRRPRMFFEALVCDRCEYRGQFEAGDFVDYLGEREGCLYRLGCKGKVTYNDCPTAKWNSAANWCVGAGSPCTGCSEPNFPDHHGLGLYGQLSHREAGVSSGWVRHAEDLAYGAFGVTVVGLGIHAAAKRSIARYRIKVDEEEI